MPRQQADDPFELTQKRRRLIIVKLIDWYEKNRRRLPWRDRPTPYGVWVSEVMLQQTRVDVVLDYYARWMERFPNLKTLAQADEDDVLRLWQGLGYYSRARRLRSGAQYVMDVCGGRLPQTAPELQQIPGIGPYSAGAISSIAFGQASPIVDGNVIRVLTRLLALAGDPNRAPLKRGLWDLAAALVPRDRPSDFNQALMDLGALICTPKSPRCHACPLSKECRALVAGEVGRYPELAPRQKPTALEMVVAIIAHRGRVAVRRLANDARWWSGLDALPFSEVKQPSELKAAVAALARQAGCEVFASEMMTPFSHSVTRFKIRLTPALVQVQRRSRAPVGLRWVPRKDLADLALPAPHRKALRVALG